MIWQLAFRQGVLRSAGKDGLKLCGDATWEGILRSIARQRCGRFRRRFFPRDLFSDAHWKQKLMPQKSAILDRCYSIGRRNKLLLHDIRRAAWTEGNSKPTRTPMMAITTNSS